MALADSVSGKVPLPGLQMATFLLCLHMMERAQLSGVFFYKDSSPIREDSTLVTQLPHKDPTSK